MGLPRGRCDGHSPRRLEPFGTARRVPDSSHVRLRLHRPPSGLAPADSCRLRFVTLLPRPRLREICPRCEKMIAGPSRFFVDFSIETRRNRPLDGHELLGGERGIHRYAVSFFPRIRGLKILSHRPGLESESHLHGISTPKNCGDRSTVASAPGPFVSSAVHNRSRRTGDTERNGVTRGCRQRRPDPGSHSRRRCLTEPLVTFHPPPPDTFVRFLDDPPLVGQHRPAEDSYRSPRIDPREFS